MTALCPRGGTWAVYVHFPYCVKRCAYCDFATAVARTIPRQAYRDAVLQELTLRTATLEPAPIASVFFGGGTPSLWGAEHVAAVLGWIDRWGGLPQTAEITLEANPGATELGLLTDYAAAGINRVSIGVQALDDRRLQQLDRVHDAQAARAALAELGRLLTAGRLKSASGDLIFGVPGQTLADLAADVAGILDHGLPHLSAYGLTVEPGTPLQTSVSKGLFPAPDDAAQAEMLAALPALVAPWGLQRYEVSNYARPDHQSRHNLAYWQGKHYLSVGMGAHGFVPADSVAKNSLLGGPGASSPLSRGELAAPPKGQDGQSWRSCEGLQGRRYANVRSHQPYLAALGQGRLAEAFSEPIDDATHLTERVLTELRLVQGLDLQRLRQDLGEARVADLVRRARQVQARGMPLEVDEAWIRVPESGFARLDAVVLALA